MNKTEKVTKDLQKRYGQGVIFKLKDKSLTMERVGSGSLGFDHILGGGLPLGRIVEYYGQPSSGKSTAALHAVAEAQKVGIQCVYVDGEHALDPVYMEALGVDLDKLIISQPKTLEEALTICGEYLKIGCFVVLDSTNSLASAAEYEEIEAGSQHLGRSARLFSQAMRKFTPAVKENNAIWLLISQMRQKIGVTWGSDKVVGVGNAIKFHASVRVEFARVATNKEKTEAVSNKTKIYTNKNKTAPPFKQWFIDVVYGEGFDYLGEIIDLGVEYKIVEKAGAYFTYTNRETGEVHKKQGKKNMKEELKNNPDSLTQLDKLVREAMNATPTE